jgi:eukaryotic-like serine/threonine-protein kinase
MTPERFRQIEELFHAALSRAPGERAAFLSAACAGDEALRREVEALLDARTWTGDLFARPVLERGLAFLAEQRPSLVGQEVGPYRILSQIGAGGMGEVYAALDTRLGRRVAFKSLLPSLAHDAERLAHFRREARAASAVTHPNVAQVYEAGEAAGRPYIVMEYVAGETLRRRLAAGPLPLLESLDIACQVAAALVAAHQAGIAHRDIKPENVMLLADGHVKVLDFGLAKKVEPPPADVVPGSFETSTLFTTPGLILGTLPYMSPEQARAREVDARTDLWSLGVLLFETLTGRLPFSGQTAGDVIAAIIERPAPPLKTFIPRAPKQLQQILDKALAKEPPARYQTARELHADLKRLKEEVAFDEKLRASAPGRLLRTLKRVTAATAQTFSATGSLRRTRMATASVFTLAALIAAGSFFWPLLTAEAPFSRITMTDLLDRGDVTEVVIAPDGKFVVYLAEERGGQRLGQKSIGTSEDRRLRLPVPGLYRRLAVSPDGRTLFFSLFDRAAQGALYRATLLDAAGVWQLTDVRKLLENVDTPVSFSPDGRQLAFIRQRQFAPGELIVAGLDGGDERVILRDNRLVSGGVAWSPQGETLACAMREAGNEDAQAVIGVSLKDGAQTPLSPDRWEQIDRLAWTPDGRGLVLVAAEEKSAHPQLWFVSQPGGEASRITADVDEYRSVSLTADSATIMAVRSQRRVQVWAADEIGAAAQGLMTGKSEGVYGLAWTLDGRIVYTSTEKGSRDLWVMNRDGSGRRPLTQSGAAARQPTVSADGRQVVFVSNRDGGSKIWRVDLDGGNLTRLTNGPDDAFPTVSRDNRWVIYVARTDGLRRLWRVRLGGGRPEPLTNYLANWPAVSPDGKQIACLYRDSSEDSKLELAILPLDGGRPVAWFKLPNGIAAPPDFASPGLRWSRDGSAVLYVNTEKGVSNLWQQPVAGGLPQQLTNFTSDRIFWFDVSPADGALVYARGPYLHDGVLITDLSRKQR